MEYFKLKKGAVSDLLYFQEIQLTCNDLYLNELCEAFEITPNEYIEKANNLLSKLRLCITVGIDRYIICKRVRKNFFNLIIFCARIGKAQV